MRRTRFDPRSSILREYTEGECTVTEWDCGDVTYMVDGSLHREDGPAATWKPKHNVERMEYWINGRLHRLDGPAITDGKQGKHNHWYVRGKPIYAYECIFPYDDEWVEIGKLRYSGPCVWVSRFIIELPIEVKTHKHVLVKKVAK